MNPAHVDLDWELGVFKALRALWRGVMGEPEPRWDARVAARLADHQARLTPLASMLAGTPVTLETARGDVRMDEVTVERMRSTRPTELGGLLQVDFDLVSTARYRAAFEWRLLWFDEAGVELHGPDHWRPTTLEVKETRPMTVVAPVPTATGWEVALRSRHESN